MLFQSNWQKRSKKNNLRHKVKNGGAGSGNFGHVGRPGMVGGSGKGFSASIQGNVRRVGDEIFSSVKERSMKEIQTEGQKKALNELASKIGMSESVRAEYDKYCSEECAKEISKNVEEMKKLGIQMNYYSLGRTLDSNQVRLGKFSVYRYSKGENEWGIGRSILYRKDLLEGGESIKRKMVDFGEERYHVGNNLSSAIKHEFGHLIACEAYCRKYGHEPMSQVDYDGFATEIVKSALGNSRDRMLNDKSNKSMSKYGRSDDGESIAESWANPSYSAETRKIHDELLKYLRMENTVKPLKVEVNSLDAIELCSGYPLDKTRIDELCQARVWRESLNKISNAVAEERKETHSLVKLAPYGFCNGGPGSGNFGHSGRPGLVGGAGDGRSNYGDAILNERFATAYDKSEEVKIAATKRL